MKYMLMLVGPEDSWQNVSDEQRDVVYAQFGKLEEDLKAAGKVTEGYELDVAAKARTLRYSADGNVVTDGPYAEAEEYIGGYYVLDCEDEQEAIEWARKIPQTPGDFRGGIEIRPILEYAG